MTTNKFHRRSVRLRGYDYRNGGMYFVTICTKNRECMFGEIVDGEMQLNDYGQIVHDDLTWLEQQYAYVSIYESIIMPNHIHAIIHIHPSDCEHCRGGSRTAPTTMEHSMIKRKPLGRLIGAFKTVSTKHINVLRKTEGAPVWQRNYYEHIIRNEHDRVRIQRYIIDNPARWLTDEEYVPPTV